MTKMMVMIHEMRKSDEKTRRARARGKTRMLAMRNRNGDVPCQTSCQRGHYQIADSPMKL
jgi:hypothetical protein